MKLSSTDLSRLCLSAITAACQAGKIISEYSGRPISIQAKTAGESPASQVVTEVDFMSQEIILQTLLPTCKKFDLALLSEETADNGERLIKDYFWCIDPLDGTLPFIEATAGYAVSIALVSQDGAPCIGVIYDPVKRTLYHAIKGQGVFRNNKPWQTESTSKIQNGCMTFIADRSFKQHRLFREVIAGLEDIASKAGHGGLNTILHGGAAMNACWVLENSPACYFKLPKPKEGGGSLWDYAASACIFNESGAAVSDIFGNPLDLNRPDSTFMNHRGILFAGNQDLAEAVIRLHSKIG